LKIGQIITVNAWWSKKPEICIVVYLHKDGEKLDVYVDGQVMRTIEIKDIIK
jgi:hypothetical protein